MSFDTLTPRVALPLLFAGQAQKEFTVNEALLRADVSIQACVEGEAASPPADPEAGRCWIVDASPSGPFAGHAGAIAAWTDGGWRFIAPHQGWQVYDTVAACQRRYDGSTWTMPLAPPAPTGGSTVDAEARAALVSILEKLAEAGVFAAS